MSRYRLGQKLGTTIYREGADGDPIGWFPGNPALAERVVELLNAADICPFHAWGSNCILPPGHRGHHRTSAAAFKNPSGNPRS